MYRRTSKEIEAAWLVAIPEGFHPTFRYPDGNKVPCVGQLLWHSPVVGALSLLFSVEFEDGVIDAAPKLPLRAYGEAWHTGWDISTKWAIDDEGVCWKDGAHGGSMYVVSKEALLAEFEDEAERNNVRKHLHLPEEEPSWMKAARAAGWTPPRTKESE